MQIGQGLSSGMVLQRTRSGRSDAHFSGISGISGNVLATVTQNGRTLKGWKRRKTGNSIRGKLSGRIMGLPPGGPYDISLEIHDSSGMKDSLLLKDVLVGDLWILAGQSNMEGIGYLKDAARPLPHVRAFYMDDRWDVAKDPIHNLSKAVDRVHSDVNGGQPPNRAKHIGVGPGVAFGQEMFRRTGIPQGLLACAHGGTSMSQWDPAKKNLGTRSLYGAMLRRFHKNGGRVAGVLWYQGCSDTFSEGVTLYRGRMQRLVRSMRRDFGDPKLPFVAVQIAGVASSAHNALCWNRIQEEQRLLPDWIPNCSVVPAIDLDMDDRIHISGKEQNRLGRRLAQSMCVLRGVKGSGKPPITLESVKAQRNALSGGSDITVTFGNVMGRLQSPGRPSGLIVGNPSPVNMIYRIDLEKNSAIIRTSDPVADAENSSLHYGYGLMPFCNITDSADRSLPVFGPHPLGVLHAFSKFVTKLRVSKAMPSAGKLDRVSFPKNMKDLELKSREFGTPFCNLHLDLFKSATEDVLVYFSCDIECSEPMKLSACIGYDGPVKLWIDGKEMYHDPKGTNPANKDQGVVKFNGTPGRHQILIAQGSNSGRAWGMFLRFMRRDVNPKLIRLGPESYTMPKIMG